MSCEKFILFILFILSYLSYINIMDHLIQNAFIPIILSHFEMDDYKLQKIYLLVY